MDGGGFGCRGIICGCHGVHIYCGRRIVSCTLLNIVQLYIHIIE
jgi:hypothetical protein